jgi:hypothetical protein
MTTISFWTDSDVPLEIGSTIHIISLNGEYYDQDVVITERIGEYKYKGEYEQRD